MKCKTVQISDFNTEMLEVNISSNIIIFINCRRFGEIFRKNRWKVYSFTGSCRPFLDLLFFSSAEPSFCQLFARLFLHFPRCPITLAALTSPRWNLFSKSGAVSLTVAVLTAEFASARHLCTHTPTTGTPRKNRTLESRSARFRTLLRLRSVRLEIFEICRTLTAHCCESPSLGNDQLIEIIFCSYPLSLSSLFFSQ